MTYIPTDKEIAQVLEQYPDIELNPEFTDEPWIRFDTSGPLGLCGCGDPAAAAEWLLKYLGILASKDNTYAAGKAFMGPDDPRNWIIQYWVDDRGWSDHGGTVNGAWITDKGRAAMILLKWHLAWDDVDPWSN